MTAPRRVRLTGDLFHPVPPPGAVNITRGRSRWGNPHKLDEAAAKADPEGERARVVAAFAVDLEAGRLRFTVDDVRAHLAGADLACWCWPDQPCHGDVLLQVANEVRP